MPLSIENVRKIIKPWRLFLVVLVSVFAIEAAVMVVLPHLLPQGHGFLHEAILDALLLTTILAPILWRIVIHPLQVLVNARTKLLRIALTAQEDERGRIARDLHDGLGQMLTSLLVGLRAVEEMSSDEVMRHHLGDLRRIGGDAHDEIRRLARGLRPSVLDDIGLTAALERYCDDMKTASGGRVTMTLDGFGSARLPRHLEIECFRIVQEATTNAIRHGKASKIRLEMSVGKNSVELRIEDNGRGFEPEVLAEVTENSDPGRLWTIRERLALLSGTLRVESRAGVGSLLICHLPLATTELSDVKNSSARGG